MRVSRVLQGGGRRFYYPRYVWTPTGGWWNKKPATDNGNNIMYWYAAYGLAAMAIFTVSVNAETSPKNIQKTVFSKILRPERTDGLDDSDGFPRNDDRMRK